jgi:hypoxanthine phosphoribosyltransferase
VAYGFLKDVIEWAGYIFAGLGFLATLYKTINIWLSYKNFSWNDVDKYSKTIIKKISNDAFIPDVIVGIGRGGSILASILSGNIIIPSQKKERNIPILGVDRIYKWQNGARVEVENKMIDFSPLSGKKVLLVAGDILTGGTMKFYVRQLEHSKVMELKTACLVKGITTTFQPDYFGKEIPADFNMPWMYKGYGYTHDSRKPVKVKKLV